MGLTINTTKLQKHLSLFVLAAGVIGYMLSMLVADQHWVDNPNFFYELILLTKTLFFSALKMIVAPMVFISLINGIISLSEVSQIGQLGRYTLVYYLGTTTIAIAIGLFVVFFIHPWKNYPTINSPETQIAQNLKTPDRVIEKEDAGLLKVGQKLVKKTFVNPIKAFTENNILGITFWAFLIGIAFLFIESPNSSLPSLFSHLNLVISKILSWVILFSPLGVFAIAFDFQLKFSSTLIHQILSFCLVVFSATMVHGLIILPMIAKYIGKANLKDFLPKISKPMLFAFSTSSSTATLPISMKTCEEDLNIKPAISSFCLPLGATMNMDGTALFEGIAAVFLAYLFGIDLSPAIILSIFFMAMISSIGAPGMPSGSMSGMQMVLIAAGIPIEGIGILLMVEKLLDTFRTAVNVEGDIIGALVVDKLLNKS